MPLRCKPYGCTHCFSTCVGALLQLNHDEFEPLVGQILRSIPPLDSMCFAKGGLMTTTDLLAVCPKA